MTIREAREQAADEATFERGPAPAAGPPTLATDYVRVHRPGADDTVHVPGEALPAEVVAAVRAAGEDAYNAAARCWTVQLPGTHTAPRNTS